MLDVVNGLPVHPLVVHGVAVLLPLAAIGAIAISVKPSWRTKYGWLVLAITLVAIVLVPVASSSGEELAHRVGEPEEHEELGEALLPLSLPMLLLVATQVVLPRWKQLSKTVLTVVSVLTVAAAVVCTVQVVRVGESGAKAVWHEEIANSPADK